MARLFISMAILCCLSACENAGTGVDDGLAMGGAAEDYTAYVGASIWDGTGSAVQIGKSLLVKDGRIVEIQDTVPAGVATVDVSDHWIVPGFVNTHGHVSGRWADESVTNEQDKVRADLALYARYGITTVISLGGASDAAFAVRREHETGALAHARVRLAGEVVADSVPEAAVATVASNTVRGADWIKLRVDDNMGAGEKMPWQAVGATIDAAEQAGIPVASHLFYLEDAVRLLEMGTGLIAHSIRDQPVSDSFVQQLLKSGVCYVPTLSREVSTFVYESRPAFFDDPFFLEAAKQSEIERVSQPEFMERMAAHPNNAAFKQALRQGQDNLRILTEAGAPIAFGTDTGPGGRFLGYFEHMEFDLMAEAGMSAEQIMLSATSVAADCVYLDSVGTLEAGHWADFVVLAENPLEDIRATRSIRDVYIAGNRVDRNP